MYSFVIKIAKDVKRAVDLIKTISKLGLINDIVEVLIVDPNANETSVIFNKTFFMEFLFLNKIHYQFQEILFYSLDHVFPLCFAVPLIDHL